MPLASIIRTFLSWLAFAVVLGIFALVYVYKPSLEVSTTPKPASTANKSKTPPADLQTVTLGAGCFWCTQAILERVDGVWEVTCGYMGGNTPNPTYQQVCTDLTGYAEVVQVKFDPKVISFADLLDWFWRLHDPTTLNRQGNDVGTQYRSVIFYYTSEQKTAAEKSKAEAQKHFSDPIVTEILPAKTFYKAEDYHQEYFNTNSNQDSYCRLIIAPKLDKLHLTESPTKAPGDGTDTAASNTPASTAAPSSSASTAPSAASGSGK